jgi:hypothetical protein
VKKIVIAIQIWVLKSGNARSIAMATLIAFNLVLMSKENGVIASARNVSTIVLQMWARVVVAMTTAS